MITIELFKSEFQNEINQLLLEISNEFETSIFTDNRPIEGVKFDQYWVALKDKELIGTVAIILIESRCAILKNMFLKKEYRGKSFNVSGSLLSKALEWSKSNNVTQIYLGTMEQFIAAQKFYRKNGFHKINRNQLPENFIINPIDTVFYRRDL